MVVLENVKNGRILVCWFEFLFIWSLLFKVYDLEIKINFMGINVVYM